MAQQRGRSQARRSGGGGSGGSGMPGWAWLVMGVLLTLVVVIGAPRLMKAKGDGGFFKPTPNPDAKAETAAPAEEVAPAPTAAATPTADAAAKPADAKPVAGDDYSFYDVLPKNEVRLSDAQLAAMAQAEAKRKADAAKAKPKTDADQGSSTGLPQPIDSAQKVAKAEPAKAQATPHPAATAPASKSKDDDDDVPAPVTVAHAKAADGASVPISKPVEATNATPYILQAGAFGDAGQAEAVKAKIAMLGLNARVESADVGGKTVYRVRMGPYASAGELAGAKSKLSGGGVAAVAVKAR
ncbi:SPOR domain-containing protein [Solilutibacter silvestris]|uniref:SPOR domain-containing protein n=1 Tax=Solilutibacter silvestris TaxID=1645665 RepID=UPI003D3263F5